MRGKKMKIMMVLVTFFVFAIIPMVAMAADTVTIQGEVNDNEQIVDSNGQAYEIAIGDQGTALIDNHVGETVKVTGTVAEDGDFKIITVTSFEVITE